MIYTTETNILINTMQGPTSTMSPSKHSATVRITSISISIAIGLTVFHDDIGIMRMSHNTANIVLGGRNSVFQI